MPPRQQRGRRAPSAPPAGRIRSRAEELPQPPPVTLPEQAESRSQEPRPPDPATEEARGVRPDEDARQAVVLAGSFADAWAAAGYLGQLLDLAEAMPTVRYGRGRWWVVASIPLNLGRELIELAEGRGYVRHGDRLQPDRGWGAAPRPSESRGTALDHLSELSLLDLVRAAGMHARPASPREQVIALVPTARAPSLLRRALEMRLHAAFRPVRLSPLFNGSAPEQQPGTLVEVRIAGNAPAGRQDRHVSESLIAMLDADANVLLCREVSPRLLVQHDRHSPLTDRQLAALVGDDAWVLADPPHGCWSMTPLAEFAGAGSLVRLGLSHQLEPGDESWPDHDLATPLPEPAELKIVPALDRGGPIDALLLDDDDLAGLPLLLQGHPLAEFATLVRGRDRHLLTAPGGIIERIPLGEYLACVGPGPIYLAHGWRTEPRLPADVWRRLITVVPGTALVLEQTRTMVFDLNRRQPVWELWAGGLPPFDAQLDADADELLSRMEEQLRAATQPRPGDPRQRGKADQQGGARGLLRRLTRTDPAASRDQLDWRERADEAERAGELLVAAKLHEDNGELERAGRLYERAAYEGPGGSSQQP